MDEIRNKLVALLDDFQESGISHRMIEIHGRNYPETISNEDVADHLIENGVTVQRWIPVAERLPEHVGKFMVVTTSERIFLCNYSPKRGMFFCENTNNGVCVAAYWMPLPDPPGKDVSGDA